MIRRKKNVTCFPRKDDLVFDKDWEYEKNLRDEEAELHEAYFDYRKFLREVGTDISGLYHGKKGDRPEDNIFNSTYKRKVVSDFDRLVKDYFDSSAGVLTPKQRREMLNLYDEERSRVCPLTQNQSYLRHPPIDDCGMIRRLYPKSISKDRYTRNRYAIMVDELYQHPINSSMLYPKVKHYWINKL